VVFYKASVDGSYWVKLLSKPHSGYVELITDKGVKYDTSTAYIIGKDALRRGGQNRLQNRSFTKTQLCPATIGLVTKGHPSPRAIPISVHTNCRPLQWNWFQYHPLTKSSIRSTLHYWWDEKGKDETHALLGLHYTQSVTA